jgi:hypothetical protein
MFKGALMAISPALELETCFEAPHPARTNSANADK